MNGKFVRAIVRESRPRQWAKNVFVLAPLPYVAGERDIFDGIGVLVLLFAAFCAAASSVYFVNDVMDVEKDRIHPTKRFRPIASGEIGLNTAIFIAIGLTVIASGVSWGLGWKAFVYLALYLTISHTYTFWAKHVAYIDVLFVGALYGVRVLAGFSAVKLQPAGWLLWALLAFLLCTLITLQKRKSEFKASKGKTETRKVLSSYTEERIDAYFIVVSILTLCVYPFAAWKVAPWFAGSLILVGLALRLFYKAVKSLEEDVHPMDVLFRDKRMMVILGAFALSFTAAVVL